MSIIRYEVAEQPFASNEIKLIYMSHSKYEDDWHSTMHVHKCTEIFYVISGHGKFRVEELSHFVDTDDLIIINPNVEHTELPVYKSNFEYIVLGIEGGGFLLEDSPDERYCAFHCSDPGKKLLHYMREMLCEMESHEMYCSATAQLLLNVFLIKLLNYKKASVAVPPARNTSIECNNVKRYIDKHYKENITLDDLAKIAHLSKYYLVHMFTKEIGVAPISYLLSRRLQESRHFLVTTNYSILQISEILGFSSPNYFSQCFQRAEGISPKLYRKKFAQQEKNSQLP